MDHGQAHEVNNLAFLDSLSLLAVESHFDNGKQTYTPLEWLGRSLFYWCQLIYLFNMCFI